MITYAIPESGTVKGRINLKDVQHIFFDTDKRFGNVEGENSNLKKRCAFIIELASRTFKLTPQRETDMQVWLRALLRIEVLHDKITERQTSIRGSLTATCGVHLEKCLGIPHLYDRILNRKMSQDGSSSDPDVPLEEGPNLFLHIHGITADDSPIKFTMDRGASINAMIMKVIRNLQPGGPLEKAGVISLSDKDFETLSSETFQIKLLLKGKRYQQDLSSAWRSEEWFDTSQFNVPRFRHLDLDFNRKINPLAKLVLKNKIGTAAVEKGCVFAELVPSYLVPQRQINIHVKTVQVARDDSTNKLFATYNINVQNGALRWIAPHRFNDFHIFHTSLNELWSERGSTSQNSSVVKPLPPLPPKTFSKVLDINFLDQRRRQLEKYVKRLLDHEWASQRAEVLSFLGSYYCNAHCTRHPL